MARTKVFTIEPIKENVLQIELVGDSPLILNKKARSYELAEIFKQSHPKGTEMPRVFQQDYCLWEKLITSITWEKPITFHDDDWSLYTEEEWKKTMQTNRPCIIANAFQKSFQEAFKTFGFKDKTSKAGTDLKRALNLLAPVFAVDFNTVTYEQKLVKSNAMGNPNVLCQNNLFDGWKCLITISCPESVFPIETVLSIIQTTGKYIGVGTRRGEGYGRYHIGNITKL